MPRGRITVDPLSFVSLFLQTKCNGQLLGRAATGFCVAKDSEHYLITNWHVLSGRHPETNQPLSDTAGLPDELVVAYHRTVIKDGENLTGWCAVNEPLCDEAGNPRWLEHPMGGKVDVAALPVRASGEVEFRPLPLDLANANLFAGVGERVSIIGFPLGLTGGALLPIWKTGHIASEPEADFEGLPVFLVDATTRQGMSGSPVVRRFGGFGYRSRAGFEMIGSSTISAGRSDLTRFMGVYASRLDPDSAEIGMVWKPQTIDEILHAHKVRPKDDT